MDQEEKSLMDENKSYTDVTKEISLEDDALKDELLSVEKKEKKIKRMGMKKSIILVSVSILLIAALIAGYMIWGNNDQPSDENKKVLYDYKETGISKISIQNNVSNETVVLTSFMNGTKEEWNIEGQKYDDVNQSAIKSLTTYATYLESKYIVEFSNMNLREYGLESPQAVVEIVAKDNSKVTIDVGKEYGSNEGTYVRVRGIDEIYIVHDYYRSAFTTERAHMLTLPSLSKTTLSAQIVSIIDKNRTQVTLAYVPDAIYGTDAWHLIQPTNSATNATAVDSLFSNIDSFALTSYYAQSVGEDIEKYGFIQPVLELQSFDIDNKMLDHLIIGNECEEQKIHAIV